MVDKFETVIEEDSLDIRKIGRIPVRNIWLLMLYASDLVRMREQERISMEENPDDIPDLIAELLCRIVERRLKRNLSFSYQDRDAVLNRVRGRINLLTTERYKLLTRGMVACRFEDFTVNTPRNRFVRAALEDIARIVDERLAHRCRVNANALRSLGVSGTRPSRAEMSKDRISRNEAADKLMVTVANLAFNLLLPTESEGNQLWVRPDRDIVWLRYLYERAVGGFYDTVLSPLGWRVDTGGVLSWMIEDKTNGIDEILPLMKTDIALNNYNEGRRIVIDTKFTSIFSSTRFREHILKSGYIYQLYTYIRSQEDERDPLSKNSAGLLLHPSIDEMVDETVVIQGHPIRFATVDLTAEAKEIRRQLIDMVNFPFIPDS